MRKRILLPKFDGIATRGEGELVFNQEIVQELIVWMDGKPHPYCDCVDFVLEAIERRKLVVTRERVCRCIEKLDDYWRLDETQV